MRSSRPTRTLLLAVLAMLGALVALTACGGTGMGNGSPDGNAARITPAPQDADDDKPDLYDDGCQLAVDEAEPRTDCTYGVPADEAEATVAVVGDSKAGQLVPALEVLAARHHWRIEVYTKSACPAVAEPVAQDGEVYESCTAFNEAVTEHLAADPVDLVLTVSSRDSAVSGTDDDGTPRLDKDLFVSGLQRTWRTWTATGAEVLVVSDTPKPARRDDPSELFEVPGCVTEHPDDLDRCSFDRAAGIALSGRDAQEAAVAGVDDPRVSWLDLVPTLCPGETCEPVIDDVLVYRDGSHLTRTYVETLAPRIEQAIAATGLGGAA